MNRRALFLAPLLLTFSSAAFAQPMAVDPPKPLPAQIAGSAPEPPTRWYGWKNLALYAGTDAIFGAGVALVAADQLQAGILLLILGGGSHIAVSPVLHYKYHHDSLYPMGSLAMHIVSPVIGVAIGRNVVVCGKDESPACLTREKTALAVGAISGAVLAMVVDVAFLSYETLPAAAKGFHPQWTMAPLVMPDKGAGLGVVGRF